jgi:hypothetical protein
VPNNPTSRIYVYLKPLIDKLQQLWSHGALTYDISTKQNFKMRACLMWTINDFPAYEMLSGWSTHGKLACPYFMDDTNVFWLKFGKIKHSWFDFHRRLLLPNHSFRRNKKMFRKDTIEKQHLPLILDGELIC